MVLNKTKQYSLFEAFLPYTQFLFSVEDILEKTSSKSEFDKIVLEKIRESKSLAKDGNRKAIKKILDKNASVFKKKLGFNMKSLTNYYDPIFKYMKNSDETTLEFCLGIANDFQNNFFNKETDDIKQLIVTGEIDFKEIIKSINTFRSINQVSSSNPESLKLGERLVYEDDKIIVYYPRSHKYFRSAIDREDQYNEISWCTKDLTPWLNYTKDFACCILVGKGTSEKNFKNMMLVSYKVAKKTYDYYTDYEETCNYFNHHMGEQEFEEFYPGFVSNVAPIIEKRVQELDVKVEFDAEKAKKELSFCFTKRNTSIFEVVLDKYLSSSIEKYYELVNSDEDHSEDLSNLGTNLVEHLTYIIENDSENFEYSKKEFFTAISNLLVSNTDPSQNSQYISIVTDIVNKLKNVKYNNGTLIDAINMHIISESSSKSMHVNYYYYIIYFIFDYNSPLYSDLTESLSSGNKFSICERSLSKILNSKSEIACKSIITNSQVSGSSIFEIIPEKFAAKPIFSSKYFENLMLGKIEEINTDILIGLSKLIQSIESFNTSVKDKNELYQEFPEFIPRLKALVDIFGINIDKSSVLNSVDVEIEESAASLLLYNDLPYSVLNNMYRKNYFTPELISTITSADYIENNKSKAKNILVTICRAKGKDNLELLNAINNNAISTIFNMGVDVEKISNYIINNRHDAFLEELKDPNSSLYESNFTINYFLINKHEFANKFDIFKNAFLKYIELEADPSIDIWRYRQKKRIFVILTEAMKSDKSFALKMFDYSIRNINEEYKEFLINYFFDINKVLSEFDDTMISYIDNTIAKILSRKDIKCTQSICNKIVELLDFNYILEQAFQADINHDKRDSLMSAILTHISEFYGEKSKIDKLRALIEKSIRSRNGMLSNSIIRFIEIYRRFVKEKKISSHLNLSLYPSIQKFIDYINKSFYKKIPEEDLKVDKRFESIIRQYVRSLLG